MRPDPRLAAATRSLAKLITPTPGGGQGQPTVCWAVITAVHAGPPKTVDLNKNGTTIPTVRYSAAVVPVVGLTVRLEVVDNVGFVTDIVA